MAVKMGGRTGEKEIRAVLSESRWLLISCGFFSVVVNLLMLTGPLFMLQVYDRVLGSRSIATLVALVVIVAFLFLMMGVLDHARGRVLARVGARLQARLDSRVLRAILSRSVSPAERARPATGLRDLEAIQRFASGSGPFGFFDAPWTPVFLFVLFSFHWMLGLLAVFSGCLLGGIALLNQAGTSSIQMEVGQASASSATFIEQMRAGGETVQGLGMQNAIVTRSAKLRDIVLDRTLAASDRNGFYSVLSKTLRLFLQSMMLGLGAMLVIYGELTPGLMIAGSILLGRALARRPSGRYTARHRPHQAARSTRDPRGGGPHGRRPGSEGGGSARRVASSRARTGGGNRGALRRGQVHFRARARRGVAADCGLGATRRGRTRPVRR